MRIYQVILTALVVAMQPAIAWPEATRPTQDVPILHTPLRLEITGKRTPTRGAKDETLASEKIPVQAQTGGQASLARIVETSSAVQTRSNGANADGEQISIRGAGGRHTEAYMHGIPLDGGSGRGYQTLVLPTPILQSVELYEGANPFGYGSNPIGGALHLNLLSARRATHKTWLGSGSYETMDLGTFAAVPLDSFQLSAGAALGGTHGNFTYHDDNGTVTNKADDITRTRNNNWRESAQGLVQMGHNRAGHTTRFLALYSGSRGGVAGSGTRQRTHATYKRHQLLGGLSYQRTLTHPVVNQISLSSFYNLYEDQLHDPRAEFGSVSRDTRDRSQLAGARYLLALHATRFVQIQQHTEWRLEQYTPQNLQDTSQAAAGSSRVQLQPGVQIHVEPVTRVAIVQSAALQHVRSQLNQPDSFGRWIVPTATSNSSYPVYRAGLHLHLAEGASFRTNYVQAHRIPSFTELFGDGLYVLPNGSLQPERARTADANLRYQWLSKDGQHWVFASLGGYYSHIYNIIQYVRSSADTFKAINLDAARLWGLGTHLGADFLHHIQVSIKHQYLSTRQISASASRADKKLPMRPESSWHSRLQLYTTLDTARHWLSRLELDGTIRTESGTYLDPANLIHIPARYSLDAGIGARLFQKRLHLRVDARNLGNQFFLDRAGFPQPGRNYYAMIEFNTLP